MFPALFAKIGIPVLAQVIGEALGRIDNPAAKTAAAALAVLGKNLNPGEIAEANRHAESIMALEMQKDGTALSEINQSLRAEAASSDAYVRRMRPTFGYLMALTWAAQMFGIAYILVFRTADAPVVLQAASSLSMIWTVGLSVLGIYVYKRSEDKQAGV